MSAAGWERFDAGTDIGVRGWGASRAEAFGQVTLGVFALLVAPDAVRSGEQREVRAQAEGPDRLLGTWIDECLYVHEIEGFVARSIEMTVCTDTLAHGVLHGEPLDPARHHLESGVRGAGGAQAALGVQDGVHEARVVMRRHGAPVS